MTTPTSEWTAPDPASRDRARRRRAQRVGLITIAIVALVATALVPRTMRKMPDFEVYWRTAHRVANAEAVNQPQDGHFQYKYLPAFAYAVIPLARLPLRTAKVVWLYVVVAAEVALVWISVYLLPNRRRTAGVLVFVTILAMLKFFAREVTLGQSNAIMALAVVSAAACDRRGRWLAAGALFAAAVVCKPYAIVFPAYLLWTRRYGAGLVAIACVAAAIALPSANYGFAGNAAILETWARTLGTSTPGLLVNPDNVSVWALYAKWFGISRASWTASFVTCVLLAIVAAYVTSRRPGTNERQYLDVALLLVLLPLWSPQGWDYVLLIATPAVVAFADRIDDVPRGMRAATVVALAVIAFSVYDVMGRELYAAFMATSAITLCALVLALTVITLRFRLPATA